MKKNLIIIAAAAAVMFTSCGKNESSSVEKVKNTPNGQKEMARVAVKGRALPFEELKVADLKKYDPDELTQAVRQIGLAKKVEAVPFLVANITNISPVSTSSAVDFSETYPCSSALVEIGEPAAQQVQRRLLMADANIDQMVLADTLRRIKGSGYVAIWLDGLKSLPDKDRGALSEQRLAELKQWVLSQTH